MNIPEVKPLSEDSNEDARTDNKNSSKRYLASSLSHRDESEVPLMTMQVETGAPPETSHLNKMPLPDLLSKKQIMLPKPQNW